MSLILWALGAGFLVGLFNLVPRPIEDKLHYLSTGALILLLISMGAKLGSDQELMASIGQIGLQSLGLALSAIFGSILLVFLYERSKGGKKE